MRNPSASTRDKYKANPGAEKPLTPETVIERLKSALRSDGDFPVRAKIVNDLRTLVANPNAQVEKITEVILREPALGTRVLHMVNSALYMRRQPITTVTQAVMQLGMRALSDICAGMVLMQKFVPAAKRGGIFLEGIRKSVLTSLLTGSLAGEAGDTSGAERGYLAGTFYNLGYMLLSYYFPQVYEAAEKRATARNLNLTQSVAEVIGVGPLELSLAIVESLQIPQYYRDVLLESGQPFVTDQEPGANTKLAHALRAANMLADAMGFGATEQSLDAVLDQLCDESDFTRETLDEVLLQLPASFEQQCKLIEIEFLTLPDYVLNFGERIGQIKPNTEENAATATKTDEAGRLAAPPQISDAPKPTGSKLLSAAATTSDSENSFKGYLDDIRQAITLREPMSAILTSAMEALNFSLDFDRVLLLMVDGARQKMIGRMALGQKLPTEAKHIVRELRAPALAKAPDIAAFKKGSCEFFGDPLFEDAWPFAAVPIGNGMHCRGVIYADRLTSRGNEQPLDEKTQAALSIIVDLLAQAVRGKP